MHKLRFLCGLVAAACASTTAAAAPSNSYYVVVPVKARVAGQDNLRVTLGAATLPSAIMGTPYPGFNFKSLLQVTGDRDYTGFGVKWSVASGQLPAGMVLNADGTLTGTPTSPGTAKFTLQASYRTKTGEAAYQVVVGELTVALAAGTAPQAIVGQAYSYDLKNQLTVSGDNAYNGSGVTWTVVSSSLPAGLTLRADGTIAGTPSASGAGSVTARATYRGVNGEQTYQVVSLGIGVSLTAATAPQAIVGRAYSYDLKNLLTVSGDSAYNGSGVTWTVVSSSLPAGLALKTDGTIAGTPSAAGSGAVTVRATYRGVNGEQTYQVVTLNLNVSLADGTAPQAIVGQAYSYDLKNLLTVSGDSAYNGSGVTWTVVSSSLPSGLALKTDGTIAGTPSAAGTGTVTARATYRGVNGEQTYQVVTLGIGVSLAAGSAPQAMVGQAYSYDLKNLLTVSGDSAYNGSGVTWTVVSSSLPAGLALKADGTIAGTPSAAGNGTVTARATYRGVNGEQTYQVVTLDIKVTLAAGTPPQAIVGQAYSYDLKNRLTVSGDSGYTSAAVTWTVLSNSLPAGLTLRADGVIAGTPSAAASGSVTARASYRGINGEQTYQVVSLNIKVSLSPAGLPYARVGEAYAADLRPYLSVTGDASYSSSAVTWDQAGGTLPPGLSLSSSGIISGTPTAETSTSVTARATYRGVAGQQPYSIYTQPAYTYYWAVGEYYDPYETPPEETCGTTIRFYRDVWCERSDGTEVDATKCTGTRPRSSRTVTYPACE